MDIIGMILPMALVQAEELGEQGLEDLHQKNPAIAEDIVIIAHRLGTAHGAAFVASTENKYDDKALASILTIVTTKAADWGLTLSASKAA